MPHTQHLAISQIVLSAVDRRFSQSLGNEVIVVRFKDDYRILARTQEIGRTAIKKLQAALREYRLELNEEKTSCHVLPDGLFREWASKYHAANPRSKAHYDFKRFQEVYLSVLAIDRTHPGTGVIDRFLADIVDRRHRLRVSLSPRSVWRVVSLLLLLARLRPKALPKVLAILEAIIKNSALRFDAEALGRHLGEYLDELAKRENENIYAIAWICYFIRANGLERHLKRRYRFADPIARATYTSRFTRSSASTDFKVFRGVKKSATQVSLLEHLDVFAR